ncbi:hypothetical protein [Pseudomonas sp. NFIX28]|uniref:hypothetical protein n=1 Tax=Pseudomonas sp. NFIX28 TaxID=1566235 RepID=UPI001113ACA1|nr:hypothetical protein [Pseudomonas sp. NFIX28]
MRIKEAFEQVCMGVSAGARLAREQALRNISPSAFSFIASKLRSYGSLCRQRGGAFFAGEKKDLEIQGLF